MRAALGTLVLAVALAAVPAASRAANRWVSRQGSDVGNACLSPTTPCKTVEHGLASALSGDTINVATGSYRTRIEIRNSTALTFLGGWDAAFTTRDPESTPTILKARADAMNDKRVVVAIAEAGETIAHTIDGFVLTRGKARVCGNILVGYPAFPSACQDGGSGLYVLGADGGSITVIVRRSLITRNKSRIISVGGGVFVGASSGTADVTIDRSAITDNQVDYAGGIELLSVSTGGPVTPSAHLLVTNSYIARNRGEGSAAIFAV